MEIGLGRLIMKNYYILILAILAFSCARVNSTANPVSVSNDVKKAVNQTTPNANSQSTKCSETEDYCLEVVEDVEREAKNINVLVGNKIKWVIKLPSPLDQNGYALNWAKKTDNGFEISIEYGSRIYFDKTFVFHKKNEGFHLTEIKVESFDKQKTEKSNKTTVKFEAPVPIEKFNIEDYMKD